MPGLRPTNAISATYGRAQPLGHPVMRIVMASSRRPAASVAASSLSTSDGR